MKKIFLLLLLLIIPYSVFAETCDPNNITLKSIELSNTTGSAEDLETTIENNKINLNVKLKDVGDIAEYDVVLNNKSSEKYYLNDTNIVSSNEYINYEVTYDDGTNVIKPKSDKAVNIKVEYREEVPDDLFDSNRFVENKTYNLAISNIQNPKTMSYFYIIVGIFIYFVFMFSSFFVGRKVSNKMITIIILILVLPLSVYAICSADIWIETNIVIEKSNYICERVIDSNDLHTSTCDMQMFGCNDDGYYIGGSKNTTTITYGTVGSFGSDLVAGDAFNCDVNNDGVFDSNTERFYYVGEDGTGSSKTAKFIYYTNVKNGVEPVGNGRDGQPSGTYAFANNDALNALGYSCSIFSCNYYGPVVAYQHLPDATQWSNPKIIPPGVRQIVNEEDTTTINYNGENFLIREFDYGNKVARFMTLFEKNSACNGSYCNYFAENVNGYELNGNVFGFWLETPLSGGLSVYGCERGLPRFNYSYASDDGIYGVRPLITVLASDVHY